MSSGRLLRVLLTSASIGSLFMANAVKAAPNFVPFATNKVIIPEGGFSAPTVSGTVTIGVAASSYGTSDFTKALAKLQAAEVLSPTLLSALSSSYMNILISAQSQEALAKDYKSVKQTSNSLIQKLLNDPTFQESTNAFLTQNSNATDDQWHSYLQQYYRGSGNTGIVATRVYPEALNVIKKAMNYYASIDTLKVAPSSDQQNTLAEMLAKEKTLFREMINSSDLSKVISAYTKSAYLYSDLMWHNILDANQQDAILGSGQKEIYKQMAMSLVSNGSNNINTILKNAKYLVGYQEVTCALPEGNTAIPDQANVVNYNTANIWMGLSSQQKTALLNSWGITAPTQASINSKLVPTLFATGDGAMSVILSSANQPLTTQEQSSIEAIQGSMGNLQNIASDIWWSFTELQKTALKSAWSLPSLSVTQAQINAKLIPALFATDSTSVSSLLTAASQSLTTSASEAMLSSRGIETLNYNLESAWNELTSAQKSALLTAWSLSSDATQAEINVNMANAMTASGDTSLSSILQTANQVLTTAQANEITGIFGTQTSASSVAGQATTVWSGLSTANKTALLASWSLNSNSTQAEINAKLLPALFAAADDTTSVSYIVTHATTPSTLSTTEADLISDTVGSLSAQNMYKEADTLWDSLTSTNQGYLLAAWGYTATTTTPSQIASKLVPALMATGNTSVSSIITAANSTLSADEQTALNSAILGNTTQMYSLALKLWYALSSTHQQALLNAWDLTHGESLEEISARLIPSLTATNSTNYLAVLASVSQTLTSSESATVSAVLGTTTTSNTIASEAKAVWDLLTGTQQAVLLNAWSLNANINTKLVAAMLSSGTDSLSSLLTTANCALSNDQTTQVATAVTTIKTAGQDAWNALDTLQDTDNNRKTALLNSWALPDASTNTQDAMMRALLATGDNSLDVVLEAAGYGLNPIQRTIADKASAAVTSDITSIGAFLNDEELSPAEMGNVLTPQMQKIVQENENPNLSGLASLQEAYLDMLNIVQSEVKRAHLDKVLNGNTILTMEQKNYLMQMQYGDNKSKGLETMIADLNGSQDQGLHLSPSQEEAITNAASSANSMANTLYLSWENAKSLGDSNAIINASEASDALFDSMRNKIGALVSTNFPNMIHGSGVSSDVMNTGYQAAIQQLQSLVTQASTAGIFGVQDSSNQGVEVPPPPLTLDVMKAYVGDDTVTATNIDTRIAEITQSQTNLTGYTSGTFASSQNYLTANYNNTYLDPAINAATDIGANYAIVHPLITTITSTAQNTWNTNIGTFATNLDALKTSYTTASAQNAGAGDITALQSAWSALITGLPLCAVSNTGELTSTTYSDITSTAALDGLSQIFYAANLVGNSGTTASADAAAAFKTNANIGSYTTFINNYALIASTISGFSTATTGDKTQVSDVFTAMNHTNIGTDLTSLIGSVFDANTALTTNVQTAISKLTDVDNMSKASASIDSIQKQLNMLSFKSHDTMMTGMSGSLDISTIVTDVAAASPQATIATAITDAMDAILTTTGGTINNLVTALTNAGSSALTTTTGSEYELFVSSLTALDTAVNMIPSSFIGFSPETINPVLMNAQMVDQIATGTGVQATNTIIPSVNFISKVSSSIGVFSKFKALMTDISDLWTEIDTNITTGSGANNGTASTSLSTMIGYFTALDTTELNASIAELFGAFDSTSSEYAALNNAITKVSAAIDTSVTDSLINQLDTQYASTSSQIASDVEQYYNEKTALQANLGQFMYFDTAAAQEILSARYTNQITGLNILNTMLTGINGDTGILHETIGAFDSTTFAETTSIQDLIMILEGSRAALSEVTDVMDASSETLIAGINKEVLSAFDSAIKNVQADMLDGLDSYIPDFSLSAIANAWTDVQNAMGPAQQSTATKAQKVDYVLKMQHLTAMVKAFLEANGSSLSSVTTSEESSAVDVSASALTPGSFNISDDTTTLALGASTDGTDAQYILQSDATTTKSLLLNTTSASLMLARSESSDADAGKYEIKFSSDAQPSDGTAAVFSVEMANGAAIETVDASTTTVDFSLKADETVVDSDMSFTIGSTTVTPPTISTTFDGSGLALYPSNTNLVFSGDIGTGTQGPIDKIVSTAQNANILINATAKTTNGVLLNGTTTNGNASSVRIADDSTLTGGVDSETSGAEYNVYLATGASLTGGIGKTNSATELNISGTQPETQFLFSSSADAFKVNSINLDTGNNLTFGLASDASEGSVTYVVRSITETDTSGTDVIKISGVTVNADTYTDDNNDEQYPVFPSGGVVFGDASASLSVPSGMEFSYPVTSNVTGTDTVDRSSITFGGNNTITKALGSSSAALNITVDGSDNSGVIFNAPAYGVVNVANTAGVTFAANATSSTGNAAVKFSSDNAQTVVYKTLSSGDEYVSVDHTTIGDASSAASSVKLEGKTVFNKLTALFSHNLDLNGNDVEFEHGALASMPTGSTITGTGNLKVAAKYDAIGANVADTVTSIIVSSRAKLDIVDSSDASNAVNINTPIVAEKNGMGTVEHSAASGTLISVGSAAAKFDQYNEFGSSTISKDVYAQSVSLYDAGSMAVGGILSADNGVTGDVGTSLTLTGTLLFGDNTDTGSMANPILNVPNLSLTGAKISFASGMKNYMNTYYIATANSLGISYDGSGDDNVSKYVLTSTTDAATNTTYWKLDTQYDTSNAMASMAASTAGEMTSTATTMESMFAAIVSSGTEYQEIGDKNAAVKDLVDAMGSVTADTAAEVNNMALEIFGDPEASSSDTGASSAGNTATSGASGYGGAGYGYAYGDTHNAQFTPWVQGVMTNTIQRTRKTSSPYKARAAGVTLGFDAIFSDDLLVGGGAYIAHSVQKGDGIKSGNKTVSDQLVAVLYAKYALSSTVYVKPTVSYTLTASRDSFKGSTQSNTREGRVYTGEVMLGYEHLVHSGVLDGVSIMPTAGFKYLYLDSSKYTNYQSSVIRSSVYTQAFAKGGLQLQTVAQYGKITYTPDVHVIYQYDLQNKRSGISTYVPGIGSIDTANPTRPARSQVQYGLGLDAKYDMFELSGGVDVTRADKSVTYQSSLKLKINL